MRGVRVKAELINPGGCPTFKKNDGQISLCYTSPLNRCIKFYACLRFLIEVSLPQAVISTSKVVPAPVPFTHTL